MSKERHNIAVAIEVNLISLSVLLKGLSLGLKPKKKVLNINNTFQSFF